MYGAAFFRSFHKLFQWIAPLYKKLLLSNSHFGFGSAKSVEHGQKFKTCACKVDSGFSRENTFVNNMAAIARRRKRNTATDYRQLNALTSCVLYDTRPRKVQSKFYYVESIIEQQRKPKVSDFISFYLQNNGEETYLFKFI